MHCVIQKTPTEPGNPLTLGLKRFTTLQYWR
jgi:hypothetical protein